MYAGSGGGGGSSSSNSSALNSAAPDFAPASGSRAIRIVNPDDPNAGSANLPPTSPPRRTPSAGPGGNTNTASASGGAGNNAGGAPPSRWSRASAIPSFQPRDHSQQQQHDSAGTMGPPPGLGNSSAALSARNVTAPVFVPKQRNTGSGPPPGLTAPGQHSSQGGGAYDYVPSHPQQGQQPSGYPGAHIMQQHVSAPGSQNPYAGAHQSPIMNPYSLHAQTMSPAGGAPPALGGPPGSMQGAMGMQVLAYQPPLYHLYAPALPHISNLSPHHLALHSFFMSPTLREELQRKNEAIRAAPVPLPDPSQADGGLGARSAKPLPEELHVYHSLIPLEPLGAAGAASADVHPALVPGSASPDARGPSGLVVSSPATTMSGEPSKVFGYRTHVYRAVCKLDGKAYALRRLEGFRLQYEAAIALVERWRRVRHPGVVCVREAFTTRAFGDSSIVFVTDYHPLASNLLQEYLHPKPPRIDPRTNRLQPVNMQIPERTLWSYIVQLAGALRAVHRAGLAARCIESSKVLKTGKNRIRIGGCSIFDVLQFDPQQPTSGPAFQSRLARQQAEDLYALGILVLQLATNSMSATVNVQAIQRSLDQVTRTYSLDLRDLCTWLLDARPRNTPGSSGATDEAPESFRTVAQLEAILTGLSHTNAAVGEGAQSPSVHSRLSSSTTLADSGAGPSGWRRGGLPGTSSKASEGKDALADKGPQNRCADELDAALNWGDLLEGELMKETENARLVRLVCKLGLINERPEFDHDPRWSETGDRYIIKLFRDYVFHAIDPETGHPVVDLSYILTNLNKLDAGSDEKIVLTSRDEQSCLVVSYRDIKNCIENAFQDLARPR